jgi:hypothetical protein
VKPRIKKVQSPKQTQKKSKSRIHTDRDLNKESLLSKIVNILSEEKDSIPFEVFRGFNLFFRTIKERGN